MARNLRPSVQWAWSFYDWANSVYSLVIGTAIFPIYYAAVTRSNGGTINILGHDFANTSLYSYSLSISFLIVAILSPVLSGIADHSGNKKWFLQFFCYLGSSASIGLYFFTNENQVVIALLLSMLASIGFWGSIVFYNSFLPDIATPDKHDELSARGFALGYLGSSILLIINLVMISMYEKFGFSDVAQATRLSFLLTGIWWAGFAQVTFSKLPSRQGRKPDKRGYFFSGFVRMRQVWKQILNMPYLKMYLLSFFLYSIGVQTIILIASLFGSEELKLESNKLILTILIIQFVAIGGSYLFAFISSKVGNIRALMISVSVWISVCTMAFFLRAEDPDVEIKFYFLGATVGLIMGGIQSLSRSTYSKMLPPTENTTSFFSFYDVTEKIAIVLGTFIYGILIAITGSMRASSLTLGVFFLAALIILAGVKMKENKKMRYYR